jgi:hypothetical protein
MRLEAMAAAREEEREKRAKPLSDEQEELKALLACVPPFDLLQASERNSKTAAAAAAAMIAADEATAATAADGRPTVGGASLDASLGSLRQCQATTMRSLQLDSLAPGPSRRDHGKAQVRALHAPQDATQEHRLWPGMRRTRVTHRHRRAR